MKADVYNDVPLVRINAPEIFADPAFKEWFFNRPRTDISGVEYPAPPIATWHRMSDPEFGEYSDFFTIVDFLGGNDPVGDGSESDMPEHIWQQILHAAWIALNKPSWHVEALLWISNLEEHDPPSPEWRLEELVNKLKSAGYIVMDKSVLTHVLNRSEIHVSAVNIGPDDMLQLINLGLKVMSPSMHEGTACWCLQFDGPKRLVRRNIRPVGVPLMVDVELVPSEHAEPNT